MPDLTVAVVIACYNQAHFLADALASVVDQSLPADEIVLIDDGSQDETPHVAANFPTIRYIRQDNQGLSAARNTGLNAVTSQFVLFLDADDMLARHALAAALAAMRAAPDHAFVYGGYRQVAEDRAVIAVHHPKTPDPAFDGLLRLGNHIAMHGTVLYDRITLIESGGFDPTLRSCEDYDVYLRLARHHPIAAYDTIAADYRRHGTSMSRNALRMAGTARDVLMRHAHSRTERRISRHGIAVMLGYYGEGYWASLLHDARGGQARRVLADLRELLTTQHLRWPITMVAVPFLFRHIRHEISRRLRVRPPRRR